MRSRRFCILSLVASVLLGEAGSYIISLWPLPPRSRSPHMAAEHGASAAPSHSSELLGRYSQGDGTTVICLTLSSSGTYSAEWEADVGQCGKSVGNWSLRGTNVVLSPSNETGMMKGHLRELDVYRFGTNWVFVAAGDRKSYEKFGIVSGSPLFHFRKDDTR